MPSPSPSGLTAISTVTATISEMPAARRKATKMRGSAAGATILTTRAQRPQPEHARDLDQARLDARHRRARKHQHRPEAGEGDDGDLQAIAEAERDQRDRNHRHRGDRPHQLDRELHQPVERADAAEQHAEGQARSRPPIARPPKALASVSRVASSSEPSASAPKKRRRPRRTAARRCRSGRRRARRSPRG